MINGSALCAALAVTERDRPGGLTIARPFRTGDQPVQLAVAEDRICQFWASCVTVGWALRDGGLDAGEQWYAGEVDSHRDVGSGSSFLGCSEDQGCGGGVLDCDPDRLVEGQLRVAGPAR